MGFLLSGVSISSGVVDGLVSGTAGTTANWQVEVFALVWVACTLPILFHLLTHPALLRRRLRGGPAGEPEPRQKIIISLLLLCLAALSVVLVLDNKQGWSHIPVFVTPIGDLLLLLGVPLALGSWWGLVLFLPILVLINWRLKDEERYLSNHLPGYRDYCARVTHRLIPSIW